MAQFGQLDLLRFLGDTFFPILTTASMEGHFAVILTQCDLLVGIGGEGERTTGKYVHLRPFTKSI